MSRSKETYSPKVCHREFSVLLGQKVEQEVLVVHIVLGSGQVGRAERKTSEQN